MKKLTRPIYLMRLRTVYRKAGAATANHYSYSDWRKTPSSLVAFCHRTDAEHQMSENYPREYNPFRAVYTQSDGSLELYDLGGSWLCRISFAEWSEWLQEIIGTVPPEPPPTTESPATVALFWHHWWEANEATLTDAQRKEIINALVREPFEIIEVEFEER